jgi:DNA-binding CsgD family transcriptional regulator
MDQWKCVESIPTIHVTNATWVGVAMRRTTVSAGTLRLVERPILISDIFVPERDTNKCDGLLQHDEFNAETTAGDAAREFQKRDGDQLELTRREVECLSWAANGKSEWEISQILGISEHTSEKHLLNAKTKLGTVNRVHAVAEAIRRGYIK